MLTPSTSDVVPLDDIIYEVRHLKHYLRNAPLSATKPKLVTWSNEWMVRRIWEQTKEIAVRDLKTFVHKTRITEVNEQLVDDLNNGTEGQARETLNFLRKASYVKTSGQRQMDVPLIITTLDTRCSYKAKALLDSGCTGSVVNKKWIEEQKIKTRPLAHPIPVYNADGTKNSAGFLTDWV